MDFTLNTPKNFPLGHAKEFYVDKVDNFYYSEEEWATTFSGFIAGEDPKRSVSGLFTNGVVSEIIIGPTIEDSFADIPFSYPIDQFISALEQRDYRVTNSVNEYDELILIVSDSSKKVKIICTDGEISAIVWKSESNALNS